MVRLARPLDKTAVRSANNALYDAHPGDSRIFDQSGGRLPLDPASPEHAELRAEWELLYLANGGKADASDKKGQYELGVIKQVCPDHFRIELKAWIPHDKVVDPEENMRVSDWADLVGDLTSVPIGGKIDYEYSSTYRGDAHAGYDGTYRVLSWIEFDWDGARICDATGYGDYGTTHRDYKWEFAYELHVTPLLPPVRVHLKSGSGSESKTATKSTSWSWTSSTIRLGMASGNPLVMTIAPNIDSVAEGNISASTISIKYTTDRFPSHGIRIIKNNEILYTGTLLDASGVGALGPVGAVNLGLKLNLFTNVGSFSVSH